MAAKDFRAGQVETSKLILSGGIANSTVGLAVYSGSKASDRSGGVSDAAMLSAAGTDVGIFISGSTSYTSRNSESTNVLFGGNLSTSGSMHFMNPKETVTPATAEIVASTPGSLLNAATFTLTNTAGTTTTYRINGGGAFGTQPGGSAGSTIDMFIGGASSATDIAEAVSKVINATTSANYTASAVGTTITITQSVGGVAGNKTNTDNSTGLTSVSNFSGGKGLATDQQVFIFADNERENNLYIKGALYASGSSDSVPFGTISGSIHKTRDGLDYLIGAGGIAISSASNGQVTIDGSGISGGSSEWTDNGGPGGVLHPADNTGAQNVVIGGTSVANSDIILYANGSATFNEQGLSDRIFRVELSSGYQGAILVDENGTGPRVSLGTKVAAKGSLPAEAKGQDVLILLSGSTGTRGTSVQGTTLNSGDLVSSGSITSLGINGGAISGSITQTKEGLSYLVAGSGMTISTGSNGQITFSSAATSNPRYLYSAEGPRRPAGNPFIHNHNGASVDSRAKDDISIAAPIVKTDVWGDAYNFSSDFIDSSRPTGISDGLGIPAIALRFEVPDGKTATSNVEIIIRYGLETSAAAGAKVELRLAGRKMVDDVAKATCRGNTTAAGAWRNAVSNSGNADHSPNGWLYFLVNDSDNGLINISSKQADRIHTATSQTFQVRDLVNTSDSGIGTGDTIDLMIARNHTKAGEGITKIGGSSNDTYSGDNKDFYIVSVSLIFN